MANWTMYIDFGFFTFSNINAINTIFLILLRQMSARDPKVGAHKELVCPPNWLDMPDIREHEQCTGQPGTDPCFKPLVGVIHSLWHERMVGLEDHPFPVRQPPAATPVDLRSMEFTNLFGRYYTQQEGNFRDRHFRSVSSSCLKDGTEDKVQVPRGSQGTGM